jgi:hypothetical protein
MRVPYAPRFITWLIGLICGILGILGHFADIPVLTDYHYLLLLIGFVALALGTTLRGM